MDWVSVAMWGFGIAVTVAFLMMWNSGEVVGEVSGIVSYRFLSDRAVRLIVRRIAPTKSRRTPIVMLQFRVFMGGSAGRLNAYEAKKMADALDQMVDGTNPKVMDFRAFQLERLPGEIGVSMDMGGDTTNVQTAALDYADTRALAKLLRRAAST